MEQEPRRELQWYTLQRVVYWVRVSGKLLFVLIAVGIMVGVLIVSIGG